MAIINPKIDTSKFFITLLLIFVAVQSSIWIASKYIPEVQFIKMGFILFLFLAVSAIVSIFMLGKNLGTLKKEDLIFIFIQFLAIVGLFIFLPRAIPQIFSSVSLEISEVIRETAGSVIAGIGEGIGIVGNGGIV